MSGNIPERAQVHARVLVGAIGPSYSGLIQADFDIYRRNYRAVDRITFECVADLFQAIERAYDIVHLFIPLASGGRLLHADRALVGGDLIAKCCECGVKVLWIANENQPDDYVRGFRAAGQKINVVMTILRNGSNFDEFLQRLLDRVSAGATFVSAWTALVPQTQGDWQARLPSCVFFAGKPDAQLFA